MSGNAEPSLFFLVGPTASGKSDVAQMVAEWEGCDILSADSMLVYSGMDIGTAKPSREEIRRVRYWGIDVVEPSKPFSLDEYRRVAVEAMESVLDRGRDILVAGGSGLYVRCLTSGMDNVPPPDRALRAEWKRIVAEKGVAPLQEALRELAPAVYHGLDDNMNPRRLVRALELARAGFRKAPSTWKNVDQPELFGIAPGRELLMKRIEKRVYEMYNSGLLEEVEMLRARGLDRASTALQGIGYREALAVLDGESEREDAIRATIVRTRRLAKRQMTWFRHQADVHWYDLDESVSLEDVARALVERWKEKGGVPVETCLRRLNRC